MLSAEPAVPLDQDQVLAPSNVSYRSVPLTHVNYPVSYLNHNLYPLLNESKINTQEKSTDNDEVVSEIDQRPLSLTCNVISKLFHEKLLIGKLYGNHDP